jgi:hypothetical protein
MLDRLLRRRTLESLAKAPAEVVVLPLLVLLLMAVRPSSAVSSAL